MHGKVVFEHFDEQAVSDPEVQKLLEHVQARAHAYQPNGMAEHYQGVVNVTTTDGQQYSARVDQPLRGPKNPTPPDQSEPKFRDCAARVLRANAIPPVLETLRCFESLGDVREFTEQLARAVREDRDTRAAA
jgi:2-methylcitrate dehydratase PrpD